MIESQLFEDYVATNLDFPLVTQGITIISDSELFTGYTFVLLANFAAMSYMQQPGSHLA